MRLMPKYTPLLRSDFYHTEPQIKAKKVETPRVYVINEATNTYGFSDHRPQYAKKSDGALTDIDVSELTASGLHGNIEAAQTLKKYWSEGYTAADGAKAVGMSLDWAKKRYAVFSRANKCNSTDAL